MKCRFATISESLRDNTSFPYGTLDEVIDNESDFRLKRINQKIKKPVSEGFWLKPLTELFERQPYRNQIYLVKGRRTYHPPVSILTQCDKGSNAPITFDN